MKIIYIGFLIAVFVALLLDKDNMVIISLLCAITVQLYILERKS